MSNWQRHDPDMPPHEGIPVFDFVPPEWMRHASCAKPGVDPELFFQTGGRNVEALKICAGCPVQDECLGFADTFEGHATTHGVFGNKLANERRHMREDAAGVIRARCVVDGCDRRTQARGLCNTHYAQELREQRREAS